MSEHVTNGNLVTVSRNLGNGVKNAIKRLSEASSGGDSPDQSQWSSPDHVLQNQRIRPQISIEHFDHDTETSSKESTPCPEPLSPREQPNVKNKKCKSHSLPAGLLLDESFRNSDEMISDLSDDLETTIELDSSLDFDKDHLAVTIATSPTVKRLSPVLKKPLKHTDSGNSTHSIMESDMSSDEENYLGGNKEGMDDEVFNEAGYAKIFDTDLKLIAWADKEFVPSCQALLQYCSAGCEKSEQIKTQLKDLSNRIIYFSSEQQRLSVQLRSLNLRGGITASLSTDQFNRFSTMTEKSSSSGHTHQPTSPDSSGSPSVSGRESGESQYDHRNYAVKVLRSVSQELIEPLLRDAADFGFAAELYQAIVQAIQKIAWKVEACLSFNDPTKQFLIYHNIFTTSVTERVQGMMIRAAPSTNHTRHSNNASGSISEETSSQLQQSNSIETIDPQRVIKRTPSGRIRPSGTVFNSDTIPDDFKVGVDNGDTSPIPTIHKSTEGTPTANSAETTPKVFRSRTATAGDTDSMGSWKSRPLSSKYGSNLFLDEYGFPMPVDSAPDYLRPTKPRRTTVSLSRNEVTSLGLTVAKRVDETIISDMSSPLLRERPSNNKEEEQRVRERLHAKLTETFKKIREATPTPQCPYNRNKSASMSDILDDAPPTLLRRHDSETRKQSLDVEDAVSTGGYSPTFTRSFITLPPQTCDDWVYLNEPAVDVRVSRDSPTKKVKSPPKSGKEKKVKKQRKGSEKKETEKKKSADNKISTSGRFTVSLRKTAQALRRMSTSVPKSRDRLVYMYMYISTMYLYKAYTKSTVLCRCILVLM